MDLGLKVKDIMTPIVISISEDTSVVDIAKTMLNCKVHRLIVLKDKHLAGIVTTTDMLKIVCGRNLARKPKESKAKKSKEGKKAEKSPASPKKKASGKEKKAKTRKAK